MRGPRRFTLHRALKPGRVLDIEDDRWRDAFESVSLGPMRIARRLATVMTPGGCIALVLISSVYTPILELAISKAPDLAIGLRANAVAPWPNRHRRTIEVDEARRDVSKQRDRAIPAGRLDTIEEFARVATFVIPPATPHISRTCRVVDGVCPPNDLRNPQSDGKQRRTS